MEACQQRRHAPDHGRIAHLALRHGYPGHELGVVGELSPLGTRVREAVARHRDRLARLERHVPFLLAEVRGRDAGHGHDQAEVREVGAVAAALA